MSLADQARGNRTSRLIDRVIGYFAPAVARRRAVHRAHAALMRHFEKSPGDRDLWAALMHARGYRNAENKNFGTPWNDGTRSGDAEVLSALPNLRARTRDIEQNDPLGSGLIGTFVQEVIGTGMRPQARTGNPAKNDALETVWRERKDDLHPIENLDNGAAQRLRFRRCFTDGEIFRKRARSLWAQPVWFEVIEAERVSTPPGVAGRLRAGHSVRDGVERNTIGRPVAYWVRKGHPGDVVPAGGPGAALAAVQEWVRVPATEVEHLAIKERSGQTRAVPRAHAILQDLRDLDLLLLASLKRVQISALLSVFIKSELSPDDLFEATSKSWGWKLDEPLEPGTIWQLFPGESIETLIPNFPVPELGGFIIMIARRIGAALGVSWQVVLRDFSESTYSSARTDKLDSWGTYDIFRAWFITNDLDWEWRSVQEDALMRGDPRLLAAGVTIQDCSAVHWIPNGRKWIDPEKEAQSAKLRLAMRLDSYQDLCAAEGKDWQEQLDQSITEELHYNEIREKAGLPPRPLYPEVKLTPKDGFAAGGEADAGERALEEPSRRRTGRLTGMRGLAGLFQSTGRESN